MVPLVPPSITLGILLTSLCEKAMLRTSVEKKQKRSKDQSAIERQNFQGSQAKSRSPGETAEHPCSSADTQIFMGGVRRTGPLYPRHLSHVPPFFVAAPLWWQFAVKLPLRQTFFFFFLLSCAFPDPCSFHLAEPSSQSPKSPCLPWAGARCLSPASSWRLLPTPVFLIPVEPVDSHAVQKPRAGLLIETADEWRKGFSITLYY